MNVLRCTATIATVYYHSTEKEVAVHAAQTSPALESKAVYSGG